VASLPKRGRAARTLAEAPVSACPHCGRESKTVQGVCADCWGVKDTDIALDLRPPPRTDPLLGLGLDLDGLHPWLVVSALVTVGVVVVLVVLGGR
jgi:hypothetical protein